MWKSNITVKDYGKTQTRVKMAKPRENSQEKYIFLHYKVMFVPGAKFNKVPGKCVINELKKWLEYFNP